MKLTDKEQLTYDLLMVEFFTGELEMIAYEITQFPVHHRRPITFVNQILVNQLHLSIYTHKIKKIACK